MFSMKECLDLYLNHQNVPFVRNIINQINIDDDTDIEDVLNSFYKIINHIGDDDSEK
ncbi:MAG: hypothetical protein MJZ34_02255 [Paludibacteraceae bacterium]|nr:hypothetical protein [Paludibacteraceae bacterium]